MERSAKKGKLKATRTREEEDLIRAGRHYANALKASIENPTQENDQKVLELVRVVMLSAANLLTQEQLGRLGKLQQDRIMKDG